MGVLKNLKKQISKALRDESALEASSLPNAAAEALLQRYSLIGDFLPYREYDEERQLVYLDGSTGPATVFGIQFTPFLFAGQDAEKTIEEIIKKAPVDSILQFGQWSFPDFHGLMNAWVASRAQGGDPLLTQIAIERAHHFQRCATDYSLAPGEQIHPRRSQFFMFVRIPFTGEISDREDLTAHVRQVSDYRDTVFGALKSMGLNPQRLDGEGWSRMLRQMLHPQMGAAKLDERKPVDVPFPANLHETETRYRPTANTLTVDSGEDTQKVRIISLTVDHYPNELYLYKTAKLAGDPLAQTARINSPFWLYTTIHIQEPEEAREKIAVAYGWVTKQCMTESAWYRQMVPHIFERRDETQEFLQILRDGHQTCRIYSGMNVYATSSLAENEVEASLSILRNAGFAISRENHINLPIFINSLPGVYSHEVDQPTQGLRRATPVSSVNAACAAIIQGDWSGNSPWYNPRFDRIETGGIPLVSRRGELSFFDVFNSETGYNFFIAARTGSGKSVLANEVCAEVLSRGGIARLVDVGGSYSKINEVFGGEIIRFNPADPKSMNPYWGISAERGYDGDDADESDADMPLPNGVKKHSELAEQLSLLRDITVAMAFPTTAPEDFIRYAIQDCIAEAHTRVGAELGAADIYEVMMQHEDQRVRDVAVQIKPYAVGHLAPWFNGEPEITFKNRFTILELEELNNDLDLRGIVMQLVIKYIERDMYLGDRMVPKLCLIDEAWDLMSDGGGQKTGASSTAKRFIEGTFRKIRKYYGTAGVIVQSLRDATASAAAMAAFENSSWKIIMLQEASALRYAKEEGLISDDPLDLELLNSVKRGNGFSELAILSQNGVQIGRFFLDPFSYYCYTSDAGDNGRINAKVEQGATLAGAIGTLANERIQKMKKVTL